MPINAKGSNAAARYRFRSIGNPLGRPLKIKQFGKRAVDIGKPGSTPTEVCEEMGMLSADKVVVALPRAKKGIYPKAMTEVEDNANTLQGPIYSSSDRRDVE